jgi:putative aldouronate transport system permease protein
VNQSILYLPHFISWVVLAGIFIQMLSPSTGVVNLILKAMGVTPVYFMASKFWWPVMFVVSGIWQGAGWGSIIYLAAVSAIDPELYEAARIDGAGKFGQIWHITLPGIKATIAIMLILRMGAMMDVGFEHIYNLQNSAVYDVADVISTYVYRVGIMGAQYSYTTAIGLFQSVISLVLVVATNKITRMMGENSLW